MSKPNWKNRTLFHGDNLGFLRAMNSESVHLIATDPPFKRGLETVLLWKHVPLPALKLRE